MRQFNNRETQRLKTLLETDMDKIEQRLNDNETETKSIRTELNRVKNEVISILGFNKE